MWIYDGENWTQDLGSDQTQVQPKPEEQRPRWDELTPELQVLEIVPVVPRNTNVPPLPLP